MAVMAVIDRIHAVDPESTRIDNTCYDEFGDGWWDTRGPVAGLHEMNPVRCAYCDEVFTRALALSERSRCRVVDIGCGGGLLTEALARLGYPIVGFDVSEPSLAAARRHAAKAGIAVDYRQGSAYSLDLPAGQVDAVVISDVLEHLHDLPRAAAEIARVLRAGGVVVFDTINRTAKSFVVMILLAQRWLRLVAPDTHDWRLFIKPEELRQVFAGAGLEVRELRGFSPAPALPRAVLNVWREKRVGGFRLSSDLAVSYLGHAARVA